jgi:hypothetical protein
MGVPNLAPVTFARDFTGLLLYFNRLYNTKLNLEASHSRILLCTILTFQLSKKEVLERIEIHSQPVPNNYSPNYVCTPSTPVYYSIPVYKAATTTMNAAPIKPNPKSTLPAAPVNGRTVAVDLIVVDALATVALVVVVVVG